MTQLKIKVFPAPNIYSIRLCDIDTINPLKFLGFKLPVENFLDLFKKLRSLVQRGFNI